MVLTITTTPRPATDLGYLLHKNPGRVQAFDLSFGRAHVVYPEAAEERCTAALILDVDPVVFQNPAEVMECEQCRELVPCFRRWRSVAVSADDARRWTRCF